MADVAGLAPGRDVAAGHVGLGDPHLSPPSARDAPNARQIGIEVRHEVIEAPLRGAPGVWVGVHRHLDPVVESGIQLPRVRSPAPDRGDRRAEHATPGRHLPDGVSRLVHELRHPADLHASEAGEVRLVPDAEDRVGVTLRDGLPHAHPVGIPSSTARALDRGPIGTRPVRRAEDREDRPDVDAAKERHHAVGRRPVELAIGRLQVMPGEADARDLRVRVLERVRHG